jgi:hypothetical protein
MVKKGKIYSWVRQPEVERQEKLGRKTWWYVVDVTANPVKVYNESAASENDSGMFEDTKDFTAFDGWGTKYRTEQDAEAAALRAVVKDPSLLGKLKAVEHK